MAENEQQGFFANKSRILGTALVLILVSFLLINWGLRDGAWAYWLGLAALLLGMILAPLSRFTAGEEEDEGENGEGQGGSGEDAEESPGKEQGE